MSGTPNVVNDDRLSLSEFKPYEMYNSDVPFHNAVVAPKGVVLAPRLDVAAFPLLNGQTYNIAGRFKSYDRVEIPGKEQPSEDEDGEENDEGDGVSKLVWISVFTGLGLVQTTGQSDQGYGEGQVALRINAGSGIQLGASLLVKGHPQSYKVRDRPVVQLVSTTSIESGPEYRFDTQLTLSHNFFYKDPESVSLRVGFAMRYVQFLVEGFENWFLAPEGFFEVNVPITDRIDAHASFGVAVKIAGAPEATRSVNGLPNFVYDLQAGFYLAITDDRSFGVDLRWKSSILVFRNPPDRFYHGALFGLRIGI